MVLVIDGSNIRAGGGVTHLVNVIDFADPSAAGFDKVIVCASDKILEKIGSHAWLEKHRHAYLNRGYGYRSLWRFFILKKILLKHNALLFATSTIGPGFNWPYVTICQNLLPIDLKELLRFGYSLTTIRLLFLRFLHFKAYKDSNGVVFLTKFCFDVLPKRIKKEIARIRVIPHGLDHDHFVPFGLRERQKSFNLLYVSIINEYKHQDKVAQAVINLNKKGIYVNLHLVGESYPKSLERLNAVIESSPELSYCVSRKSGISYRDIHLQYKDKDAFIFASSCETFGMIITEAMSMGMPIACSNKSSMPETILDAGVYFDPEEISSIEKAIVSLVQSDALRLQLSQKSISRAKQFNWKICSEQTFAFLAEVANEKKMHPVI